MTLTLHHVSVDTDRDEMIRSFIRTNGLKQAEIISVLSDIARAEDKDLKAFYQGAMAKAKSSRIFIDEDTIFSRANGGCWVSAWFWVDNSEAGR